MLKVLYIVNNYQLSGKVKTTQTDKIISQNRIDKSHTELVYNFESVKEKEFCDKVLSKTGKIIES